jgi:hypothetical protein
MSVKFETLKAGDVLYDVTRERWSGWSYWLVKVKAVDFAKRTAIISWNNNPDREVNDRYFKKARIRRKPKRERKQDND